MSSVSSPAVMTTGRRTRRQRRSNGGFVREKKGSVIEPPSFSLEIWSRTSALSVGRWIVGSKIVMMLLSAKIAYGT